MERKYKCMGCRKIIRLAPGQRMRKFHDYACYARSMAKASGQPEKWGKQVAERQKRFLALSRTVLS